MNIINMANFDIDFRYQHDYGKYNILLDNILEIKKCQNPGDQTTICINGEFLQCHFLWSAYDLNCSFCKKDYKAGTTLFFQITNKPDRYPVCCGCKTKLELNYLDVKKIEDMKEKYVNFTKLDKNFIPPDIINYVGKMIIENNIY